METYTDCCPNTNANLSKAEWIDRFANRMSKLEKDAEPWFIVLLADELWSELFNLSPEHAATVEHEEWPR